MRHKLRRHSDISDNSDLLCGLYISGSQKSKGAPFHDLKQSLYTSDVRTRYKDGCCQNAETKSELRRTNARVNLYTTDECLNGPNLELFSIKLLKHECEIQIVFQTTDSRQYNTRLF